jgi:DNA-directed RNA polymerase subunit RPC12/RpoP
METQQLDDKENKLSGTFPRYIAVDSSTKITHIIVSENPESLCGEQFSTPDYLEVVPDTTSITSYREIDCPKCSQEWEEISDNINPEPTQTCHGCDGVYHMKQLAITSKHATYPRAFLCKRCYKMIRFSEDTDIETPFEEQNKGI